MCLLITPGNFNVTKKKFTDHVNIPKKTLSPVLR